jgi:hypothetical protein
MLVLGWVVLEWIVGRPGGDSAGVKHPLVAVHAKW